MLCQWDEAKNQVNRKNHGGLDFETAARAFDDPAYVLVKDRLDENGEQRFHAIGQAAFPGAGWPCCW
jgi:uncharacterized DUF497 family protein